MSRQARPNNAVHFTVPPSPASQRSLPAAYVRAGAVPRSYRECRYWDSAPDWDRISEVRDMLYNGARSAYCRTAD